MTHHFLKPKKSFNAHSSTKYVRFILLKISLGATYAENVNALSHSTHHWEPRALKCQIMFPPTRLPSLFWVHPLILCKRKWHRLSNFDQFGWAKKTTHYNRSFIQFLDRVHTFESMTMKTCPMHLRVTLKQNNTV